jgi:hypothetical protein
VYNTCQHIDMTDQIPMYQCMMRKIIKNDIPTIRQFTVHHPEWVNYAHDIDIDIYSTKGTLGGPKYHNRYWGGDQYIGSPLSRIHQMAPLAYACHWGHIDIVRLLLDHGADINGEGNPMAHACEFGYTEIIRLLLKRGAVLEAELLYEGTPISSALELINAGILDLLCNIIPNEGQTFFGRLVSKIRKHNLELLYVIRKHVFRNEHILMNDSIMSSERVTYKNMYIEACRTRNIYLMDTMMCDKVVEKSFFSHKLIYDLIQIHAYGPKTLSTILRHGAGDVLKDFIQSCYIDLAHHSNSHIYRLGNTMIYSVFPLEHNVKNIDLAWTLCQYGSLLESFNDNMRTNIEDHALARRNQLSACVEEIRPFVHDSIIFYNILPMMVSRFEIKAIEEIVHINNQKEMTPIWKNIIRRAIV